MGIEGKKETLIRIGYNISYLRDKEGRNDEKELREDRYHTGKNI